MTGPEQHANTVRGEAGPQLAELLSRQPDAGQDHRADQDWCVDCGEWVQEYGVELLDALIALRERADTLERELDEATKREWADPAYDPLADCLDALRVIRDQANVAIQRDKRLPYLTHIVVLADTALARTGDDRG